MAAGLTQQWYLKLQSSFLLTGSDIFEDIRLLMLDPGLLQGNANQLWIPQYPSNADVEIRLDTVAAVGVSSLTMASTCTLCQNMEDMAVPQKWHHLESLLQTTAQQQDRTSNPPPHVNRLGMSQNLKFKYTINVFEEQFPSLYSVLIVLIYVQIIHFSYHDVWWVILASLLHSGWKWRLILM